jgi:predicted TIM-barrel fold metal-dependent hydrolase
MEPKETEFIYIDGKLVRYNRFGRFKEIAEQDGHGHLIAQMFPPGATDPVARLADMDSQGVWSELLFPSRGLWIYLAEDPELTIWLARIYNDWVLDTYMNTSARFVGTAVIPLHDLDLASEEVHRVAGLGYQAVCLPCTPPPERRYNSEEYEPFWSLLEEAGLRACFHVGTGEDPKYESGAGGAIISYVDTYTPAQRALCYLVAAGVLERHPILQVAFIECGASWLVALMERMNESYLNQPMFIRPKLRELPGEYVRRQVHVSFQHDRAALRSLDLTGLEAVMFGTDYPHPEGTWPDTQATLAEVFQGVPDDVAAAVAGGNFARLFRVPMPSVP